MYQASVTSEPRKIGLSVLTSPTSPATDIVFVHGYSSDPKLSWCAVPDSSSQDESDKASIQSMKEQVCWPRDFLPLDIPSARVLTFGYATKRSRRLLGDVDEKDILETSNSLLEELVGARREDSKRPLIFVGHGLGGNIIKHALIKASRTIENTKHPQEIRVIYDATLGVIFYGTHHYGILPADTGSSGALLQSFRRLRVIPTNRVVETIRFLGSLRDDFVFLISVRKWTVYSFQEIFGIPVNGGPKVVENWSSCLGDPMEIRKYIAANHFDMCKFTSRDEDMGYLQSLDAIRHIIERSHLSSLYTPLSFQKFEIRLLRIHPSESITSPLVCTLRRQPLSESPKFVALSYCWGTDMNLQTISLNNIKVRITANLHGALERLRAEGVNYLWVDALCINQLDSEERSVQVMRMSKVYHKAERVAVWLGGDDGLSQKAFAALKPIPDSGLDYASCLHEEFVELLLRPYWTRVWIIQELAAASEIVVFCGHVKFSWNFFLDGIRAPITAVDSYAVAQFQKLNHFRESKRAIRPIRLIEALYRSQSAFSTDPRDKLYALLGLSFDGDVFIPEPDYSQSVAYVYTSFMTSLIERGFPLDIILLRSAERGVDTELPSWVVDWDDLRDGMAAETSTMIWGASSAEDMQMLTGNIYPCRIVGDEIRLRGRVHGKVNLTRTTVGDDIAENEYSNNQNPEDEKLENNAHSDMSDVARFLRSAALHPIDELLYLPTGEVASKPSQCFVHSQSRNGDLIAQIMGCSRYVVLRPNDGYVVGDHTETGKEYHIVGEALLSSSLADLTEQDCIDITIC